MSTSHEISPVGAPSPLPRYLVGVSTKMYFTHAQTLSYVKTLISTFRSSLSIELSLFVIPSFPSLVPCAQLIEAASGPRILLGGQDCHSTLSGPHTGSVSATQLKEVGCSLVELGHAERRAPPFTETEDFIAEKVRVAVKAELVPLVCIGERRKSPSKIVSEGVGLAIQEVGPQVENVLSAFLDSENVRDDDGKSLGGPVPGVIFAYEPVWAIGASEPAGADHVNAVVGEIRTIVKSCQQKMGLGGINVRILYGGSAGPGLWQKLKDSVDGLFLGRFAHDMEYVKKVVEEMSGE